MNTLKMGLFAAAAIGLLTTQAAAQSPVGNWVGKIEMDVKSIPQGADPNMKKMIEQTISKISFKVQLKADKTFSFKVDGLPQQAGEAPKAETGTWSQKGDTITLVNSKKEKQKDQPKLKISKDGKSMTLEVPKESGMPGKISFKRA